MTNTMLLVAGTGNLDRGAVPAAATYRCCQAAAEG